MNYFVYFVGGEEASQYLGGTNYVGLWADTQAEADSKVKKYFTIGTPIMPINKSQVKGEIGYLY